MYLQCVKIVYKDNRHIVQLSVLRFLVDIGTFHCELCNYTLASSRNTTQIGNKPYH